MCRDILSALIGRFDRPTMRGWTSAGRPDAGTPSSTRSAL
jgi:hypothetical protein